MNRPAPPSVWVDMRTPDRTTTSLAATALLVLLLAGCSSASTASTAPSAQAATAAPASASVGATLAIAGFAFSPLSVKAGETVTVTNADGVDHTVTVADVGLDVNVPAGGTATFTAPAEPGDYALTCDFHKDMTGTLTVTG